jgi:hypothetical protein
MAKSAVGFEELLNELTDRGALLDADANLASVARMIIGGPFRGSSWAHPMVHEIYDLSQKLMHHRDVLYVRLLCAKMTYVHRRIWSELYSVATAGEAWQFEGLPASAMSLFAEVGRRGRITLDELRAQRPGKDLANDARTLEARLLVHARETHTQSGAHTKLLETWPEWRRTLRFEPIPIAVDRARKTIDDIVARLNSECPDGGAFAPWQARPRRTRATARPSR